MSHPMGLSPAGALIVRAGEPFALRVIVTDAQGAPQDMVGKTFALAFLISGQTDPFMVRNSYLEEGGKSALLMGSAEDATEIFLVGASRALSYYFTETTSGASFTHYYEQVKVEPGPEFPSERPPVVAAIPAIEVVMDAATLAIVQRGAAGDRASVELFKANIINDPSVAAMNAYLVDQGGLAGAAAAAPYADEAALAAVRANDAKAGADGSAAAALADRQLTAAYKSQVQDIADDVGALVSGAAAEGVYTSTAAAQGDPALAVGKNYWLAHDGLVTLYTKGASSSSMVMPEVTLPAAAALAAEIDERHSLIADDQYAFVPGIGEVAGYKAGPDGTTVSGQRMSDGRTFLLSREGEPGIAPTEGDLPTYHEDLEVPGFGAATGIELADDGTTTGFIRTDTGRRVAIGRAGTLGSVPTEGDLPTYYEDVEVPGYPDAICVELAADGSVVGLVRSNGGRRLAVGANGELAPVPTERDLVTVAGPDPVALPGQPADVEISTLETNDAGDVAGFRDDRGRSYVMRNGLFVPTDAPYYDVVIYGSSLGALTAARAAYELGCTVCIITADDRLGGMMSGGISVLDTAVNDTSSTFGFLTITGGYTRAFILEVNGHYNTTGSPRRAQARVMQAVANRWGGLYAKRVILNSPVHDRWQSLVMNGKRIVGFNTAEGPIRCGQVIDASYTGDVLRESGASWTWGQEAASSVEPDTGFNYPGSNFKTGLNVKAAAIAMGYASVPEEAYSLNQAQHIASTAVLPAQGSAQAKVMAYNIRSNITNAADRLPFSSFRPANYDRRRFIVSLAEAVKAGYTQMSEIMAFQDGAGATLPKVEGGPDTVKIYNTNGGIFGTHVLPSDYPTARWSRRNAIARDVMDQHTGFFYFFATDPTVASLLPALQADVQAWGFDPREWNGSPFGDGLPNKIYERETIRLVTDSVLTKPYMQTAYTPGGGGIGIFRYGLDTKPLNYIALDAEGDGSNVTIASEGYASGAGTAEYAIPLAILQPRRAEVTNLVVAWCVSTTHHAWKSLRMEPSSGLMGEAAGVNAALAQRNGLAIQDITEASVRTILSNHGAILP